MIEYQEFSEAPAYEEAQWKDAAALPASPGKARWAAKFPPPPIGARILVTINNCGPAVVTGYFVQHDWLGILCELTDPPEWHVRQNKGNRRGHVFGPEFKMDGGGV